MEEPAAYPAGSLFLGQNGQALAVFPVEMAPQPEIQIRSAEDEERTRIVLVSESTLEHGVMRRILNGSIWHLSCVFTCRHAIDIVSRDSTPVVVCDRRLPDGYWTDLFEASRSFEARPEIIVTSKNADERLWAEVLSIGGSDVLGQPFETREVVAAVSAAWHRWNSRRHSTLRLAARVARRY